MTNYMKMGAEFLTKKLKFRASVPKRILIASNESSDGSDTILSNIIFRTSNKLERVHQLMTELEHLNFGFKWMNIEPKRPSLNHSSSKLKHNFSIIEQTRTWSSFGNRTQTPYFWLWTIEHRTSNIVWPITKQKAKKS